MAWSLQARLTGYEAERRARLAERRALYPAIPAPGLLSLVTPVWNADPGHLQALADSVLNQEGDPPFEWVIHDNASTDPGTRARLAALAAHPAVSLVRAERNLGIIGGLRACLERATGRYVLPIDHDDYLYPDALRIVAWHLAEHDYPALLYTDEDKLYGTRHCQPYFKPDWDPVLFVNAAYIAHLCAFERERALALGLWSDATYEGCHDWDGFMRFWQAGHRPAHVPEVLYGWRMHPGSTSANIGAKRYVYDSQRALLERFVAGRAHPERYAIELNPFFPGTPNWHIRRLPGAARPIVTVAPGDPADAVAVAALRGAAAQAARDGALVRLRSDRLEPVAPSDDDAMLWEAVGLFELFPDTAMVGGRIVDANDRVIAGGGYFGFGSGAGSPDDGHDLADPGYHAQAWQQHSVDLVPAALCVVDPALLLETLDAQPDATIRVAQLGAWLGAQARRLGRRVVYSPFLIGRDLHPAAPTEVERAALAACHRDLPAAPRLWSPRHPRV